MGKATMAVNVDWWVAHCKAKKAAFAASRRALTMAEREMRLPSTVIAAVRCGSMDKARAEEQATLERIVRAKGAIGGARTAMRKCEGER